MSDSAIYIAKDASDAIGKRVQQALAEAEAGIVKICDKVDKDVINELAQIKRRVSAVLDRAELICNSAVEIVEDYRQPSTRFRPDLTRDGNNYVMTYGAITGVGVTPARAAMDFDFKWKSGF